MRTTTICACLAAAAALALGCSDEDLFAEPEGGGTGGAGGESGASASSLGDSEHVKTWALTASAPAMYVNVYEPVAFIDEEYDFIDPNCPARSDDGTLVTISGDCEDTGGTTWTGSATIERRPDRELEFTFDGYGHGDVPDLIATLTGTAFVQNTDDGRKFAVSLKHEGGVTTTFEYSGNVTGSYDGPTIWNGTGEISRSGPIAPTGSIRATTIAELVDDEVCSGQPASGETRLEDDEKLVVVRYDGATDCDMGATARWELDGVDQGTLSGIVCSVGSLVKRPPGSVGPLAFLTLLASLLRLRRTSASRREKNSRASLKYSP